MTTNKETFPKPFRSFLSYTIFLKKYAHQGCETWEDLCRVLVEEVVEKRMTQDDKDRLIKYMQEMKFIPGGRYLYYANRPVRFYNNCLEKNTKVLTTQGWRKVSDLGAADVVSPVDGKTYPAKFLSRGVQQLQEIVFTNLRGKSDKTWKVKATRTHHWPLQNGEDTYDLRVGDIVPASTWSCATDYNIGFTHGFIYGDGSGNGAARVCGEKVKHLWRMKPHVTVTYPYSNSDAAIYCKEDILWKELPSKETSNAEYIASFIEGWLAADGGSVLTSVDKESLVWFQEHSAFAGIVSTGQIRSQIRDITFGDYSYKNHQIFIVNYQHGSSFSGFKVASIEHLNEEEVFCPEEPVHNRIIIDHNIDTYQCYLLRAEEDTREDWAQLSWKAESCLLTGGGIGVDYSRYRDSSRTISRTGGRASGPIPKMFMVNELGRNIMQGGSRRSAIYASLNHAHGDVNRFLDVKDWTKYPVGKTGRTLQDIKQEDFDFPAPLDQTNISVNYDTAWLEKYYRTGEMGEVFLKNVEQALTNGEPGFSFNFFDKEDETLRNACTEVTSSDDSDVCNLGSLNLSRITCINEFADVVKLGTLFLLCGTLKADLPYEGVRQVRQKNRRLGLGLMGVHEWLLQRGYIYDVVPELHKWLVVYRGVSAQTSKAGAAALSISEPVANRAIAPTGTIGLIAGTTTGIEPIYAVAFKRRYLTDGIKRKYQYEVDQIAQTLINQGIDPEKIETASDLALDYERRIKFQADIQDYVDMSISSTINLPAKDKQEFKPLDFAKTLAKYAPRLRGFTCYPDGARGGQPITSVPYEEAVEKLGTEFDEHVVFNDICDITNRGGSCGN